MPNPYSPKKIKATTQTGPTPVVPEIIENPSPEQIENAPVGIFDGSVKDTLEWVGEDKERAQVTLEVEESKEEPRKSLVKALKELLGE